MEDYDERRRTEELSEGFPPSPEPISNLASQRSIGSLIPDSLWNLAVKLAGQHGLSLTVRVLKLDDYGLKKQTQDDRSQHGHPSDLPQEAVKTVLAQGNFYARNLLEGGPGERWGW